MEERKPAALTPEATGFFDGGLQKMKRVPCLTLVRRSGSVSAIETFHVKSLATPLGTMAQHLSDQSSECTRSPLRSFGSNQVLLGGMISPASDTAIS